MYHFDALSIMSQQVGHSLIFDTHYDFGRISLCFIGDKLTVDRNIVYYARFCQLIFNFCYLDVKNPKAKEILSFNFPIVVFQLAYCIFCRIVYREPCYRK